MAGYEAKYKLGDLVEVKSSEGPVFGIIESISFRKTDAVNYIADYKIALVNLTDSENKHFANDRDIVGVYYKEKRT